MRQSVRVVGFVATLLLSAIGNPGRGRIWRPDGALRSGHA